MLERMRQINFCFCVYRYVFEIMFNLKKFFAALVIALTGISCAQASEFAGPYAGLKIGQNWSDASGVINKGTHSTTFPGLTAGYGFDVSRFVIGPEVFADFHHGSSTYKDGGVDLKFGMPFNLVMPYARLGVTGTWPNARVHGGLGVEYKFMKKASVAAEWTADSSSHDGTKRRNDSLTIGFHYYF
jgi:outer membrane immunogenic protein